MRRRNCVCNGYPFSVRYETTVDDNEVRILECRPLVLRAASTRSGITRGFHVGW